MSSNLENRFAGHARIVEFRRANRRNKHFELYKILLEVIPTNSKPAFSTVVVWDVEPAMKNFLQIGNSIPVKINPLNFREILPDLAGFRYLPEYQNVHLLVENDFQPEQIIAAQNLAPPPPPRTTTYRKRSKTFLFGMPLWEIAMNLNSAKYAPKAKARAVIAFGDSAKGVIAIGNVAVGLIAIGRFSLGLISIGGFSFGVFPIGLFAIGVAALGTLSGGLLAIGGVSAGVVSAGLLQFGVFLFGKDFQNPILAQLFQSFKNLIGLDFNLFDFVVISSIIFFAIFIISMIGHFFVIRMLQPNSNLLESPRRLAKGKKAKDQMLF